MLFRYKVMVTETSESRNYRDAGIVSANDLISAVKRIAEYHGEENIVELRIETVNDIVSDEELGEVIIPDYRKERDWYDHTAPLFSLDSED